MAAALGMMTPVTSTTVDRPARRSSRSARGQQASQRDWSASHGARGSVPDTTSERTFSPARAALPWALLLLVLSAVAVGYTVVLGVSTYRTGALVLVVTVLGAVTGLSVRGARDRRVSPGRALAEGLRRLGHALWS